nr:hypothetical protein Iba_chr01dCG5730 [Ipomoea batatas]
MNPVSFWNFFSFANDGSLTGFYGKNLLRSEMEEEEFHILISDLRIYMKIFILCNQCLRASLHLLQGFKIKIGGGASVESFDPKICFKTFLGITKHERQLMHLGIMIRNQR